MRQAAMSVGLLATTLILSATVDAQSTRAGQGTVQTQVSTPGSNTFSFIENKGQWGQQPTFFAKFGSGLDVWLTRNSIKYDFYTQKGNAVPNKHGLNSWTRSGQTVELQFLEARTQTVSQGLYQQAGYRNFLYENGNYQDVRSYSEAFIRSLYDGIDLRMYEDKGSPRFDLIVSPGADPKLVKFKYDGVGPTRVIDQTTIGFQTRFGEVKVSDLYAYQNINGKQSKVNCSFVQRGDGSYGFNVGSYDSSKPLIIDPIVYSTLIGAPFANDAGFAVTTDRDNNPIFVGFSQAPSYPTTNGAFDNTLSGSDAVISKFRADGGTLIFSTFFGGSGSEQANAVKVDSLGRVVVGGLTSSTNLPTTPTAFQLANGGGQQDGFLARLASDGRSLNFGSYVGGLGNDNVVGVGVDGSDNFYAAGTTNSPDFQTTPGAFRTTYAGGQNDGFALRVSNAGNRDFATFLGGSGNDSVAGMAVSLVGELHVAGSTNSGNFPTTVGAWDRTIQGSDAFVTKFDTTGSSLAFSTVIGGSSGESVAGIAIDVQGNSYIAGGTSSVDFPRTPGVFDNDFAAGGENYAVKLALDGSSLVYATFLGGAGLGLSGVAVDDLGVLHMSGTGLGLPGGAAVSDDNSYGGDELPIPVGDGGAIALDEAGANLMYATFFGGWSTDMAFGIHVDPSRNAYAVGATRSHADDQDDPFPTTPGAFKQAMFYDNDPDPAFFDGWLAKFKVRPDAIIQAIAINPGSIAGTETATGTVTLTAPASPGGAIIRLSSTNETVARPVDGAGNQIFQITIPEGQTVGTFQVASSDVVNSFALTIDGELEGDIKHAPLTVAPWLTNLTLTPNTVVGGNKVTGRVNLFRPATGGMTVSVSSTNALLAYMVDANGAKINSFVVPAGLSTAAFDLQTRGVDATTLVTVNAKISTPNLQVTRSQTLQILRASLRNLVFAPARVNGGESSVGTVNLDGEVGPTPMQVNLALGTTGTPPVNVTLPNPAYIFIRKNANNPELGKSGTFNVTASIPTGNAFRNVIASRTSPVQQVQGALFVDSVNLLRINLNTTSVIGGGTVTGNVELTSPAAASGVNLTLTTSDPTFAPIQGGANGGETLNMVVPAGASRTGDFNVLTKMTTATRNATLTASKTGYTSRTATITIRALSFSLSVVPGILVGGSQNATGSITLTDLAPTGGARITLTNSDSTALTIPGVVTVPEGQSTASFNVTSKSVTTPRVVTITASLPTLPSPTVQSATVTVNPLGVNLSITPTSVIGGNNATGSIVLTAPAGPGGLALAVRSTTLNAIVPQTVTIPTGGSNATFNIGTKVVTNDITATITAKTATGMSGTATLTIRALAPTLTINPTSVVGGAQNAIGTVTLNGTVPTITRVNLTSNQPAGTVAQPEVAAINIPAGQTQGTFNVRTYLVASTRVATITAMLLNSRGNSATITVNPIGVGVSLSPATVIGGLANSSATVTLAANAPAAVRVNLSSSNTSAARPTTTSQVIAAGTRSTTFAIQTFAVASDQNVTIRADLSTGVVGSAVLTVRAPQLSNLTLNPTSVIGGNGSTGTVRINVAAATGGAVVAISSNNANVTVPGTVTIPSGSTFANFPIQTRVVANDQTATITASRAGVTFTAQLEILAPTLVSLKISPNVVKGGVSTTGTVTLDKPAPAGGLVIALSKSSTSTGSPYVTIPATVTIPAGSRIGTFTITTQTVSRIVAADIIAEFAPRGQTAVATVTLTPQ